MYTIFFRYVVDIYIIILLIKAIAYININKFKTWVAQFE